MRFASLLCVVLVCLSQAEKHDGKVVGSKAEAGGAKSQAGGSKAEAGGAKSQAGGTKAGGTKSEAGGSKPQAGGPKSEAGGSKQKKQPSEDEKKKAKQDIDSKRSSFEKTAKEGLSSFLGKAKGSKEYKDAFKSFEDNLKKDGFNPDFQSAEQALGKSRRGESTKKREEETTACLAGGKTQAQCNEQAKTKAKEVFIAKGGDAKEFEKEDQKGRQEKLAEDLASCNKSAAECKKDAKASFLKLGGDEKQFEKERKKGATSKAATDLSLCLANNAGTTSAAGGGGNQKGRRLAKDICEAAAKEAFFKGGGGKTDSDFSRAKREGARDIATSEIKNCKKGGESKKACDDKAMKLFKNSGGDEKDFWREKFLGASKDAVASLEGKDCKKNRKSCESDFEKAFEDAGGNTRDFRDAMRKGGQEKADEELRACFDEDDGTNRRLAGHSKKSTCFSRAKEEFKKAGGDEREFEREMKKGAIGALSSKIDSCRKDAGDDKARQEECDKEAKAEYKKKGLMKDGLKGEMQFEKAKKDGAMDLLKDQFKTCIDSLVQAGQVTDKKAQHKECDRQAKEAFDNVLGPKKGGQKEKKGEYAKKKREASASSSADNLQQCMTAEGITKDSSKDAVKAAKAICIPAAKAVFEAAGGNTKDFAMQTKRGMRKKIAENLESCTEQAADDAAKAACKQQAKDLFVEAGGDAKKFEVEKKKAAASSVQQNFEACVESLGENITADGKAQCDDNAKAAYEQAGGDATEYEVDKRNSVAIELGELVQSCKDDTTDERLAGFDGQVKHALCEQRAVDEVSGDASAAKPEDLGASLAKAKEQDVCDRISACVADGDTATTCTTAAVDAFVNDVGGEKATVGDAIVSCAQDEATTVTASCSSDTATCVQEAVATYNELTAAVNSTVSATVQKALADAGVTTGRRLAAQGGKDETKTTAPPLDAGQMEKAADRKGADAKQACAAKVDECKATAVAKAYPEADKSASEAQKQRVKKEVGTDENAKTKKAREEINKCPPIEGCDEDGKKAMGKAEGKEFTKDKSAKTTTFKDENTGKDVSKARLDDADDTSGKKGAGSRMEAAAKEFGQDRMQKERESGAGEKEARAKSAAAAGKLHEGKKGGGGKATAAKGTDKQGGKKKAENEQMAKEQCKAADDPSAECGEGQALKFDGKACCAMGFGGGKKQEVTKDSKAGKAIEGRDIEMKAKKPGSDKDSDKAAAKLDLSKAVSKKGEGKTGKKMQADVGKMKMEEGGQAKLPDGTRMRIGDVELKGGSKSKGGIKGKLETSASKDGVGTGCEGMKKKRDDAKKAVEELTKPAATTTAAANAAAGTRQLVSHTDANQNAKDAVEGQLSVGTMKAAGDIEIEGCNPVKIEKGLFLKKGDGKDAGAPTMEVKADMKSGEAPAGPKGSKMRVGGDGGKGDKKERKTYTIGLSGFDADGKFGAQDSKKMKKKAGLKDEDKVDMEFAPGSKFKLESPRSSPEGEEACKRVAKEVLTDEVIEDKVGARRRRLAAPTTATDSAEDKKKARCEQRCGLDEGVIKAEGEGDDKPRQGCLVCCVQSENGAPPPKKKQKPMKLKLDNKVKLEDSAEMEVDKDASAELDEVEMQPGVRFKVDPTELSRMDSKDVKASLVLGSVTFPPEGTLDKTNRPAVECDTTNTPPAGEQQSEKPVPCVHGKKEDILKLNHVVKAGDNFDSLIANGKSEIATYDGAAKSTRRRLTTTTTTVNFQVLDSAGADVSANYQATAGETGITLSKAANTTSTTGGDITSGSVLCSAPSAMITVVTLVLGLHLRN